MNRNEFIKALTKELENASYKTVQEVLSDINEHFDAGLASGRTEEEIAARLGSPAELAAEVRAGEAEPKKSEERGSAVSKILRGIASEFEKVANDFREFREFDAVDIREIDARGYGCNVEVQRGDSGTVTVEYSGSLGQPPIAEMFFLCVPEDGKLSVRAELNKKKKGLLAKLFESVSNKALLKITLPDKSFEQLHFESSMGRAEISLANAGRLSVISNMGKVAINGCVAQELEAHTEMGSVSVNGGIFGNAIASSNMGSVHAEGVCAERLELKTEMGSVRGSANSGKLIARSNMGSIHFTLGKFEKDIELHSEMGSVNLTLCEAPEKFNYSISTNMGTLKSEWPQINVQKGFMGAMVKNDADPGGAWLRATTNMGSIKILRGNGCRAQDTGHGAQHGKVRDALRKAKDAKGHAQDAIHRMKDNKTGVNTANSSLLSSLIPFIAANEMAYYARLAEEKIMQLISLAPLADNPAQLKRLSALSAETLATASALLANMNAEEIDRWIESEMRNP